jgi:hypothetical protein
VVAAPLGLASVERRATTDGDEDVLQRRPARMVRVRIAGRDGLDAERARELAQLRLPAAITAFERSLQLDEEPVSAERARKAGGGVRVPQPDAVPCASREADESLVPLARTGRCAAGRRVCACAAVISRQRFA